MTGFYGLMRVGEYRDKDKDKARVEGNKRRGAGQRSGGGENLKQGIGEGFSGSEVGGMGVEGSKTWRFKRIFSRRTGRAVG